MGIDSRRTSSPAGSGADPHPERPRPLIIAAWAGVLVAVAVILVGVRAHVDHSHVALLFLLVVLVGTANAGRAVGFGLAAVAFLLLNWFFVPPYGTFSVAKPLDWLALGAFLVTSIVAAQLLARARAQADEARRRAEEIDRLSAVGAETLSVARAEDALTAITTVVRTTLGVDDCLVYVRPETGEGPLIAHPDTQSRAADSESTRRLVEWVGNQGTPALERHDGAIRVLWDANDNGGSQSVFDAEDARVILLPLRVHERTVGVLRLSNADPLTLDAAQRRFLGALSHYAALAVERVRLTAEAERSAAFREADRLKDALLASVSHDLRTPLTTIKALAHDLRTLGDERIETIEQEADRLNRFVVDLLDLSRLNAGSLSLRIEINAVDDLIGVVMQQTSGILDGRRVHVRLDGTAPVLFGRFDLVHSVRVLVNLVQNACKYSPPGSSILLSVQREGGWLSFSVSDDGAGVPPAERDRIFAPFYRPAGVASDAGGAGLGLAIARGLAEAQDGTLTYEPRAGGGSTFTLRLPAAEIDEVVAQSL